MTEKPNDTKQTEPDMPAHTSAPWEDRIRTRFALAANAVAALRAGRRKDTAGVLRELWRTWEDISFVANLFPELVGNFTVATARDILAARIEELLIRQ